MSRMNKAQIMSGVECASSKIIGNNVVEYIRNEDGTRVIRHFRVDILEFKPDGTIVFNTGGHRSVTTKRKLNDHQVIVQIWTTNRVWYARNRDDDRDVVVFKDGMTYHPDRGIENAGQVPDSKLVKAIRSYATKFVASLPCNPPNGGDCWFCLMKETNTERSMGDLGRNVDHLISHIEEDYFVPSLLVNALREAGQSDYVISACFTTEAKFRYEYQRSFIDSHRTIIKRAIVGYLWSRLIDGRFDPSLPTKGFAV